MVCIFLNFLNIKLGGGYDTSARVSSLPSCIIDVPCDMLLRSIKYSNYFVELLHMKIFYLLFESNLDFLGFPKHKTGWGVRYPVQGNFTSTLYY